MQPRFVDLHTHTTASDGTDAPRDLIRRAASLKLAAVAVTDHDTVSGLDEAEAAGREYGHWMPSCPACVGTGKSAI